MTNFTVVRTAACRVPDHVHLAVQTKFKLFPTSYRALQAAFNEFKKMTNFTVVRTAACRVPDHVHLAVQTKFKLFPTSYRALQAGISSRIACIDAL